MRLKKAILLTFLGCGISLGWNVAASAQCSSPPNTLANGQATDATKVMGNFTHLTTCLNSGQLTVPPVSSLGVTGVGGGTITLNNPVNTSPYTLSLPSGTGTNGQVLTTNGSGQTSWTTPPAALALPLVDGVPIGRPAAASLSWANQGTASYTEYTNGPITLTVPASGSDQIRQLGQAPPGSTPYTLTVKLDAVTWGANYHAAGIYVRDSVGKIITLSQLGSAGNPANLQVAYFNSATSFSSNPKVFNVNGYRTYWLRIRNDGTNWNFYWSLNGADWVSIYTASLTAFLGATISSVGVFGDPNNSTYPDMKISVWSYELATGSGTDASW